MKVRGQTVRDDLSRTSALRRLLSWLLPVYFALTAIAHAAPNCPAAGGRFPALYSDRALFTDAIARVTGFEPSNERLTGITVPHHLLAAHLVATGFKAASGFEYKRVILLAPDHFRRGDTLFSTTARGFDTVFGAVAADAPAVARLLEYRGEWIADSCLFDREHGVHSLLPFLRRFLPEAKIVPVAMSIRSGREDWDRLAEALAPLVDTSTLIVQSTDFSHYHPRHRAQRFDQQTLNVLASGSLGAIAALRQPDHADSVGALYVQAKLQRHLHNAAPLVVANENSQQYVSEPVAETTSYIVVLFGQFEPAYNDPSPDGVHIYNLAGDTNFGRGMKRVLLSEQADALLTAEILLRTKGRPLLVNLEGVILPNVPEALDEMTLAMPRDLTVEWLRKLNVAGVSLANNHAYDLGPSGYAETLSALAGADIPGMGQGERLTLPGLDVVFLSDLDTNSSRQTDLLSPVVLDRIGATDGVNPVVAFVHWGREYVTEPSDRERWLAEEMRLRGASVIVGAHPHAASAGIVALAGGEAALAHSLGNFLFDQSAPRASGTLLELRVFPQGTIFPRLIPLPNFFDMGRG